MIDADTGLGGLDGPAGLTPSGLPDLGPLAPTPAEIHALIQPPARRRRSETR
jgi:hypothetical protein